MEPLEVEFGVTAKMNTWRGEMKLRSLLLCVLFIMGTAGQVYGQAAGVGPILGRRSEASAPIIPRAKHRVKNPASKTNRWANWMAEGNHAVRYALRGTSWLTVEAV